MHFFNVAIKAKVPGSHFFHAAILKCSTVIHTQTDGTSFIALTTDAVGNIVIDSYTQVYG